MKKKFLSRQKPKHNSVNPESHDAINYLKSLLILRLFGILQESYEIERINSNNIKQL